MASFSNARRMIGDRMVSNDIIFGEMVPRYLCCCGDCRPVDDGVLSVSVRDIDLRPLHLNPDCAL